jgi:23S rRNA pseudouridine2605 synthase
VNERLQKILAHAGVASRRTAEKLISSGRVSVNGTVVSELGTRADPDVDRITVDGQRISRPERHVYLLVNKPRNVMSTVDDPEGRPTVSDIVRSAARGRLYPVGRLDFTSEGLLIMTNDGEFTRFMTRAGQVPKHYRVKVTGVPEPADLDRLRRGMAIGRERFGPCRIEPAKTGPNMWFDVVLKQGRNRQIHRMFEAIGHRVMTLRRTQIGFLEARGIPRGKWRELTASEIAELYSRYGGVERTAEPAPAPPRKTPKIGTKPTPVSPRPSRVRPSGPPRGNGPARSTGQRRDTGSVRRTGPARGTGQARRTGTARGAGQARSTRPARGVGRDTGPAKTEGRNRPSGTKRTGAGRRPGKR